MAIEQDPSKRIRVLLADDNKDMREAVIRLLENDFDVVGAVADGRALVSAAEVLKPDVGVVDISMPLMNGLEAAVQIKKQTSTMKIIFLTVNEDADFVRAAFDAGGTGYVVKRLMASDLRVAIDKALSGCTFASSGCDHPI